MGKRKFRLTEKMKKESHEETTSGESTTSKLSSKGSDTISKRARLLDTNFYPTMFFTEGCVLSAIYIAVFLQ